MSFQDEGRQNTNCWNEQGKQSRSDKCVPVRTASSSDTAYPPKASKKGSAKVHPLTVADESETADNLGAGHPNKSIHGRPAKRQNGSFNSTSSDDPRLLFKRRATRRALENLANFVDSRFMLFASVVITIWALIGDDLRLLCTDKPADIAFNILALLCLTFFSLEIILSSIAKPDYFLGFFFILDVVCTLSLVLDLTWISDLIVGESAVEEGADRARGGRTARMGASVGRVVRVLRLIRIVKLYKAFFEKRIETGKRDSLTLMNSRPGDNANSSDDWDSDAHVEAEKDNEDLKRGQSVVGKMLVALTTRRVILLVLAMLLVLPNLSVESSSIIPMSAWWAADGVWTAMRRNQLVNTTESRSAYEQKMIMYMYYHNWFAGNWDCPGQDDSDVMCARNFLSHAFWVGLAGNDVSQINSMASRARISATTVNHFETEVVNARAARLYDMGTMPPQALAQLSGPWDVRCTYAKLEHRGLSLLSEVFGDSGKGGNDYRVVCPTDLRPQEKMRIYPMAEITESEFNVVHLVIFFDMRRFVREEAGFSVITTFFVCIVLCTAALTFSRDANELVLHPVERMIEKVNVIRRNPLNAINMADAEFEKDERRKYRAVKKRSTHMHMRMSRFSRFPLGRWLGMIEYKWKRWRSKDKDTSDKERTMETVVLERTIIKLGSLLALGFGEAGVNIVAHNMKGLDTAGVNSMIPGVRVDCIIGNASVRDFSLITEVLQGKVMTFVNQIAEIVHGVVNENHGASNKNNGDTFLIIWRAEFDDTRRLARTADMAVLTFARIISAVERSPLLARYRQHPALQQRLGSSFKVELRFGLHFGWTIEGAVGSDYKIDASYLSPNVNIAASLTKAAATVYNVPILISETVVKLCTEAMASKCRLIDKVMIKSSTSPLQVHCVDLDYNVLEPQMPGPPLAWSMQQRFKARQLIEIEKRSILAPDLDMAGVFDSDRDISAMRRRFSVEFFQIFNMGYQNYSEGEWSVARRLLSKTYSTFGFKDGPSHALLGFMEQFTNCAVPEGWKGIRELQTK